MLEAPVEVDTTETTARYRCKHRPDVARVLDDALDSIATDRTVGPHDWIGVRGDSHWNVPEPELALLSGFRFLSLKPVLVVVNVGEGELTKDGKHKEFQVKVGDRVLFSSYAGTEIKISGDEYLIMGEDDILAPEEAFRVSANGSDGTRLQVQWTIAEGTYLYQDKIKLELGGDGVQLGEFELPPPDIKKDSIKPDGTIGDVAVYHDRVDLDIPLVRTNTDATEVALTASYQGCADRGICYPPQKTTFKLGLPAASGLVERLVEAGHVERQPFESGRIELVGLQSQAVARSDRLDAFVRPDQ